MESNLNHTSNQEIWENYLWLEIFFSTEYADQFSKKIPKEIDQFLTKFDNPGIILKKQEITNGFTIDLRLTDINTDTKKQASTVINFLLKQCCCSIQDIYLDERLPDLWPGYSLEVPTIPSGSARATRLILQEQQAAQNRTKRLLSALEIQKNSIPNTLDPVITETLTDTIRDTKVALQTSLSSSSPNATTLAQIHQNLNQIIQRQLQAHYAAKTMHKDTSTISAERPKSIKFKECTNLKDIFDNKIFRHLVSTIAEFEDENFTDVAIQTFRDTKNIHKFFDQAEQLFTHMLHQGALIDRRHLTHFVQSMIHFTNFILSDELTSEDNFSKNFHEKSKKSDKNEEFKNIFNNLCKLLSEIDPSLIDRIGRYLHKFDYSKDTEHTLPSNTIINTEISTNDFYKGEKTEAGIVIRWGKIKESYENEKTLGVVVAGETNPYLYHLNNNNESPKLLKIEGFGPVRINDLENKDSIIMLKSEENELTFLNPTVNKPARIKSGSHQGKTVKYKYNHDRSPLLIHTPTTLGFIDAKTPTPNPDKNNELIVRGADGDFYPVPDSELIISWHSMKIFRRGKDCFFKKDHMIYKIEISIISKDPTAISSFNHIEAGCISFNVEEKPIYINNQTGKLITYKKSPFFREKNSEEKIENAKSKFYLADSRLGNGRIKRIFRKTLTEGPPVIDIENGISFEDFFGEIIQKH